MLKGVAKTLCTSLKLENHKLLLRLMQELRSVLVAVLSLLYFDIKYAT